MLKHINSISSKPINSFVDGTGKNTESLVNCIDGYFTYIDNLKMRRTIPYGKVFAVFDKDSFSDEQFNNAIHIAIRRGYIPIWSNECIELWFLLHFNYYDSKLTRDQYYQKLSDNFKSKYKKNDNHFQILDFQNNIKTAMQNAKKLYCESECINSCAKRNPCTTVFLLIEEIEKHTGLVLH